MSESELREAPRRARRIVVKVGSGFLTDDGRVRNAAFGQIARQVAKLVTDRRERDLSPALRATRPRRGADPAHAVGARAARALPERPPYAARAAAARRG